MAYFQLLGTGPSTPITDQQGRNVRRRSSALMQNIATYVLLDATHDFEEQVETAMSVTAVAVTNGSRDAAGGLGNLDRWLETPIPLCVPLDLWEELLERYGPFERLEHLALKPGESEAIGDLEITPISLPTQEGKSQRPNYGYHFNTGKKRVTYASDLKLVPDAAVPFFEDNDLLVVDGAGWDKDLPNHRGALNHLQEYVEGRNERIIFTDVGRSAPPHAQASSMIRRMCAGADLGFDFMKVPLGR